MGLDSGLSGPPAEGAGEARIDVEVVRSIGPGTVQRCRLSLPAGSRAADALARACERWRGQAPDGRGPEAAPALDGPAQAPPILALWGRRCAPDQPLRSGDRLEWLRPLQVDPKESRRLRFRRTGGRQGGIERGAAVRSRKLQAGGGGG